MVFKSPRKTICFKTPKKRSNRTPLTVRQKTPRSLRSINKSLKSENQKESQKEKEKVSKQKLRQIESLNEGQTISELKNTLNSILSLPNLTNITSQQPDGYSEDILKLFLGLKITKKENKTFFNFENNERIIYFSLVSDNKYPDSYYYELLKFENVKLPEFMSVNITFKKCLSMRFFMEVFIAMTSSQK